MYVHFCKCVLVYMSQYVHGMYMVRTSSGMNVYVHCSDAACMYMFIHLCTRFQSYKRVRTMYKPVYQGFVYLVLNVQTRKATYIL
jgi:hypothetical protein